MTAPGWIVVLNGAPRSGKSSIARVIQETFEGAWMNLGVDVFGAQMTPARYQPGIGLRPGGERPDLEQLLPSLYAAMYESIASHSRQGLHVVVDVGHHDGHSKPLGILGECARRLDGLPAWLIGVRCPIEVIVERRNADQAGREGMYLMAKPGEPIPEPILRWQEEVHRPGIYDLEVDTSVLSPAECAEAIRQRMGEGAPPTAFRELARQG